MFHVEETLLREEYTHSGNVLSRALNHGMHSTVTTVLGLDPKIIVRWICENCTQAAAHFNAVCERLLDFVLAGPPRLAAQHKTEVLSAIDPNSNNSFLHTLFFPPDASALSKLNSWINK